MAVFAEEFKDGDIKNIDSKIQDLESLQGYSEDDALRYLLIAYLYQMKLESSVDSYKFSREDFEKAHRNYMICLDMLRTNARARASVLENLAWLHFDARNYSFSMELFLAREKLPFVNPTHKAELGCSSLCIL